MKFSVQQKSNLILINASLLRFLWDLMTSKNRPSTTSIVRKYPKYRKRLYPLYTRGIYGIKYPQIPYTAPAKYRVYRIYGIHTGCFLTMTTSVGDAGSWSDNELLPCPSNVDGRPGPTRFVVQCTYSTGTFYSTGIAIKCSGFFL